MTFHASCIRRKGREVLRLRIENRRANSSALRARHSVGLRKLCTTRDTDSFRASEPRPSRGHAYEVPDLLQTCKRLLPGAANLQERSHGSSWDK